MNYPINKQVIVRADCAAQAQLARTYFETMREKSLDINLNPTE